MSINRIPGNSVPPAQSGATDISPQHATPAGNDFRSNLRLQVATLKAQSLETLVSSLSGSSASATTTSALEALSGSVSQMNGTPAIPGLTASGRIASLRDPELAYRMMSVINQAEVTYQAQYSELNSMREMLASLQQATTALNEQTKGSDTSTLPAALSTFGDAYNAWIKRFDADFAAGGALHGNQAAQVVRSELRNIVEDIFNGAASGMHGLGDLGLSIDANTQLATFDPEIYAQAAGNNANGVRQTIHQFAAHFMQATALLASSGNFIDNRLNNLQRALDFIASNKPALQAEFGLGDPARPVATGATTTNTALASYAKTATL